MPHYQKIFTIILFLFLSSLSSGEELQTMINELKQSRANNDHNKEIELLNKIGFQLWEQNNFQDALEYLQNSLTLNKKLGNENALLHLYSSIGMIYTDLNQHESALLYFRKSLQIKRELGEKRMILSELINIATTLSLLNRYYESITTTEEALTIAKSINEMSLIKRCYGILADNYDKIGDTKKAIEYFNIYSTLDKHIQKKVMENVQTEANKMRNIANQAIAEKEETQIELIQKKQKLEKTESDLKKSQLITKLQSAKLGLQESELREKEIKLRHKNLLIQFQIVVSLAILFILLLLYRNFITKKKINKELVIKNKEINEQKEIINKKNNDISQSLSYAQRIQDAIMLPSRNKLQTYLPESFVFYKPRDVVSGDFYWLEQLNAKSFIIDEDASVVNSTIRDSDEIILAAADCTGHGVPGAIMSMIGNDLLEEIISHRIYKPEKILDALHRGVKNTLRQDITENSDGMDIALCKINKIEKTVEFAGAMNPLIYFKNGEMHEVEGDIFPIGRDEFDHSRTPYTKKTIEINSPISFYMFSDGFQDQIGGKNKEKYLAERFKNLLQDIHTHPMSKQAELLEAELYTWMNNENEQVDDILVIGFRMS